MHRIWALIERELRRFVRSPFLIFMAMTSPLLQFLVMGSAFGGNVRDLRVAIVDHDRGIPAIRIRELANAVAANARTFVTLPYSDEAKALADLKQGKVDAVLTIPADFSRRTLTGTSPRLALVEDNTDRFASMALTGAVGGMVSALDAPKPQTVRMPGGVQLDVVELFPFVPYIQYLLPGSIVMSIFTMVMLGGAFSFIDDKSRGLHEGYFMTPITTFEMVAAFSLSGAIKAVCAGLGLLVAGSLLAGIPHALDPVHLVKLIAVIALIALGLVSMISMLMARVNDIMVPRIVMGILSTLLFFSSGAVYPIQAFPAWMRVLAAINPFTYAVHALRSLLIKDAGFAAISGDLAFLVVLTVVTTAGAVVLSRRTL